MKEPLTVLHEITPRHGGGAEQGPPCGIFPSSSVPGPTTTPPLPPRGWPSFLQATWIMASLKGFGPWGSQPAPRPGAWDHRSGVRGGGCRQSQLVCIRGRGLQTHTDSSTRRVGSTASHRAVKTQHFQTPGQTWQTLWFKHTFRGHHLA